MINRCPTKLLQAACAAAALLAFAPNAIAECLHEECDNVKIEKLFPDQNHEIVWVATTGTETNLSCIPSGNVWLGLHRARSMFDPMYNALLQGLLQQKTMWIRSATQSDPCDITGVQLGRD